MRTALLTLLLGCLATATPAGAAGEWVLWARTCDVKSQTCAGEWQRRQTYEAERWCRAARTTLVNQAFTREAWETTAAKGKVIEYQCLPSSANPGSPAPK
jgi:hypothetical protein